MGKYKILLSGKNSAIIDDFFFHMVDDFKLLSTSMRVNDLTYHLELFRPDIFVLCLGGEARENFNRMGEQQRRLVRYGVKVFIIGTKEDCDEFQRCSHNFADMVMEKPLTIDDIRQAISRFMQEKEKEEEEQKREAEEQKAIQEKTNRRKHVLVIDDDPIMLKIIKEQLSDSYDVATAISGKIAYKFLDMKRTDMILLDYEMPVEDGPEVFKKIREKEMCADIPIVFLTGISERKKITTVLALKPQGYLLKPIDKEKLLETIEKFIG